MSHFRRRSRRPLRWLANVTLLLHRPHVRRVTHSLRYSTIDTASCDSVTNGIMRHTVSSPTAGGSRLYG